MARVPYLQQSDLAAEHQDLLARNITLFQALVNSPNAARAFSGLGQFIRFKIGRDFGVSDADIRALIAETEGKPNDLDPLAKAVLRAAREMTDTLAISA